MREIYVFVDARGVVRYVGCSSDARRRYSQHWRYRHTKNTPCAAWLRTLEEAPRLVVVDEIEDSYADTAEEVWITFFRVISGNELLNVTTGGASGFKRRTPRPVATEETRAKLLAANRGKVVSDETRRKMREATSARWRGGFYQGVLPSKRPKQSEAMKRQWVSLSPEEREARVAKMRAGRKDTKHSPETKQKIRDAAIAREERKRREREGTHD